MKVTWYTSAVALAAAGALIGGRTALAQDGGAVALPEVTISTTPVPGSVGLDANKVPASLSTVTSADFGAGANYAPNVAQAITQKVPAAIAINVDGSDLSPDLFYRGFDASRVSGKAAGLAVYQNGVRINESFGDAVNLDLIPPIAIDHADIYTNNPIFGLNALGGAINFTMKNGFTYQGGEATILGGSHGRLNGTLQYGKQVGNYSVYFAVDGFRDGGYRPFGAQNAERAYADLGYRSLDSEIHVIGAFGRSLLGVQGVTPQVLVNQQYNAVFTTPQTTNNQAGAAQLTGHFDISPHWTVNSNFYVRQYDQYHVDGNDANVQDCGDLGGTAGTLCQQPLTASQTAAQLQFVNRDGTTVPSLGDTFPYGTTANTSTHTTSVGAQLQATNKDTYYGHENYFVFGGSVDTGTTNYSSTTSIGQLNAAFQNITSGFPGAGTVLNTASQVGVNSTFVHSVATYYGVFALDTFNITKELALTAGARFNVADIALSDVSGQDPELNSSSAYRRINPVVGLTYTFSPKLTIYGGYSEANRAPTPLESACSDPTRPCVLESALVSDPPLQQVVSHTIEAGARGIIPLPGDSGTLAYKAGYFHTVSDNDIVNEASPISGQGYYVNVPETRRQGVEAGVIFSKGPWSFYGNYAYVDATYQFTATFSSPNNPFADANGNILVTPGDHIPGIPRNIGKIGAEYEFTPRLKVGADAIFVGSQYFVGDDSNQNQRLPFYYVVNAHASYKITDHIEVFGLINNLLDRKYATYGTFYDTGTDAGGVNQTLANNNPANGGPGTAQAVTVAQPLSFYGGIKVTF
jgi:iron complex outermembrane receptor protein